MRKMSIKSQLEKIDPYKLKAKNGKTYAQILKEETYRLRDCIQNRIDEYMRSHPAELYIRTGRFASSLRVEDIMNMQIMGRTITLNVFFDESGYHQSGDGLYGWHDTEWQGNGETVNTAYLLNYGYEVKKNVWFKDIENFGHREPAHFIEDGVADFESYNPYGIIVQIHKPDRYIV